MLNLTKHLYMSTLTSFTKNDMLKIDVSPGEYKLIAFEEGYVFSKTSEDLKNLDIVKIFATRDGDKGLTGTYYGGESDDHNQLRLFTTWLYKNFDTSDETYRHSFAYYGKKRRIEALKRELFNYDAYEARSFNFEDYNNYDFHAAAELERNILKYIKRFKCYNNLPFLFYLNKEVTNFDDIQLVEADQIDNCGYLWKVYEGEDNIGFVVQKKLHDMLGDQAGIALFEGAVAFGNFDHGYYYRSDREDTYEEGRNGYQCRFDNCECDTLYEAAIRNNALRKSFAEYYKKNKKAIFSRE